MNDNFEYPREFKGVWIPKVVYLDGDLTALEKIILIEIDSLDIEGTDGCYASDEYLARFCQCSEAKVSKAVAKLKSLGYVKQTKTDGRKRWLRAALDKNFDSLVKNDSETSKKYEAGEDNLQESNIDSKYKEKDIDNNIGSAGGSHSHATPSPDGVNIYSPFQRKGSANSGRKNRYIPEDYTGAQLKEHIEPVIREEVEKCDEFGYTDLTQTTSEIIEVISAFYAKYYVRFRKRHRVLSDEAYRNIVHRYLNAPDEIRFYGPRIYYELMDKYFSTKFNQKGRYNGAVEMSVSHFMTFDILQNLYYQFAKEIGVE